MDKKAKKPNMLKNNLYLLGKIAQISPLRVFNVFLKQLLDRGVWAFFTVVFMRYLFGADEITRTFDDVAMFLIATTTVMFLISLYNAWHEQVFIKREDQRITFALNRQLFDKATSVDVACYENPDFYDSYTKAATEVSTRAQSVLYNCANLIASSVSSAFVIYTIVQINVIAAIFTFLSFVGSFVFGRIWRKIIYDRDMENVPHNRRINYVNRVMYLPQYAKEIRLSNIYNVLRKIYNDACDGIFKTVDKYWKKYVLFRTFGDIICFPLVFEGMWLFAAYLAIVPKTILIGDFIVLANAIVSTTWMLFGVRDGFTEGFKNALFIENLKTFLDYQPVIDENQPGITADKAKTLELKNVSFRYTDNSDYILKNISITVKAGEKIALVGHNGAGKTTLVKLIMRLYDPTEGQILLNGIDIRQYNLREYRALIGVAFQDFQMFSLTSAENVIMKRLETPEERERAVNALKQSGVYEKIAELAHKEDTVLTREFDDNGASLSGGEYQKIATARAFAKNAALLILDEPSSALDPVAEYMMYETIHRLCESKENEEKIAIIISHRLSSAVSADRIYMMEHGEIIESGTHRELISLNSMYADMFFKQAKSYLAAYDKNGSEI
jgi:ATP-binding cassette subfamily B protein